MNEELTYGEEHRDLQAAEMFQNSEAPLRHRKFKQLNNSGDWGKNLAVVIGKLGSGFTFSLMGPRGTGKTQFGVEVMRANCQQLRSCRYCTATGFFLAIKAGYKTDGESESEILDSFVSPRLLVIDEIAKRSENDWENKLLFEMLNRRYNGLRDTLLISSHAVGNLESSLGDSLVSRLNETGGVIECTWPSYREQK